MRDKNLTDIIIVSNSPGELSALVKPLAYEIKERYPDIRLTLIITPCQYQSGREKEFAQTLKLDQILTPKDYKNFVLRGKLPPGITFGKTGKVLFVGGDLAHAAIIAKRLRYRAYAYLGEYLAWPNAYEKFFVADKAALEKFSKNRAAAGKLVLAGNLMVDSAKYIECADDLPVNPDQPVISFLPGSRSFQIDYLIPYYLKIFKHLFEQKPEAQVVLSLSPFITLEQIEKAAHNAIHINTTEKYPYFEYLDRTIYITQKYYKNTDLAVTIPGTNTAQLALIGIPMLVIFPLDKPEVIPLEGIGQLFSKIPVLGKFFMRWVARIAQTKIKYWSLPNIKTESLLIPEMVGDISPEQVAEQILLLLADKEKLAEMKSLLPTSLGSAGAAKKIVNEVISR
ncbi:MAG: hypothetical protein NT099_08755 [Candidatus Saganbacteria bacterium]|nr:hypothetical protein [Candidatus Saganbacteria bacterium]